MNIKTIVVILLLVGAAGAAYHFLSDGPVLKQLLTEPAGAAELGYADIEVIVPGPDLAAYCEPGRVTVFAFVSESCPACINLHTYVQRLTNARPDVAIRFVDLGRTWGGQDYQAIYGANIRSVPHVMIYSAKGKLLEGDDGRNKDGLKLLCEWMNAELNRQTKRRYAQR